ncbi:MAG: hypothetical protein V7L12_21805 [Nostoc sp.]
MAEKGERSLKIPLHPMPAEVTNGYVSIPHYLAVDLRLRSGKS